MNKYGYTEWVVEEKKKLILNSSGWFFQINVLLSLFLLIHFEHHNPLSHPIVALNIGCATVAAVQLHYLMPSGALRAWQILISGVLVLICGWSAVFYHLLRADDIMVMFPLSISLLLSSLITLYLSPLLFSLLTFSLTMIPVAGNVILRDADVLSGITACLLMLLMMYSAKKILERRFFYATERESENTRLIERLSKLASKDPLTGIANRRYFSNYLDSVFPGPEDNQEKMAVILIDIDFFKNFNDCYGHQAGDECLISIAGCLEICTRRTQDLVARYGGEEFIILLPRSGKGEAIAVAKRIRDRIARRAIPHKASSVAPTVTVSQGVAEWTPGVDSRQLIENADRALYQAKSGGRNNYVLYQDQPE
ncbi:diguanylate cyclase [Kluyvera intermedia]|uniref:diguanylate cyclase n=1 Tax=Kluyvera intermedia TaxID=61648 RepID=UPI0035237E72